MIFSVSLELTKQQELIGERILKEIRARVGFLDECRAGISVAFQSDGNACPAEKRSVSVWQHRSAPVWSAYAYILDEPSIGLHQRDNDKLLAALKESAGSGQYTDRGGT